MIVIIDYGSGNLRSVSKACEKLGAEVVVTSSPDQLKKADKIILPGVGAFADAAAALDNFGFTEPLKKAILNEKKPYLGICLGMQLLFEKSEEADDTEGLSIFKGTVKKFPTDSLKVPHMGWNQAIRTEGCPLFSDIPEGSFFYFCHSFYCAPQDNSVTASVTDYGEEFTSSVHKDNIFGVQFHPEKSQRLGLQLLKNFLEL